MIPAVFLFLAMQENKSEEVSSLPSEPPPARHIPETSTHGDPETDKKIKNLKKVRSAFSSWGLRMDPTVAFPLGFPNSLSRSVSFPFIFKQLSSSIY